MNALCELHGKVFSRYQSPWSIRSQRFDSELRMVENCGRSPDVLLWEIIPTHSSLRKWQSRFDPRNGRVDNVAKTGIRKVSLIGWNFCAKIQKPSNNQSERPQLSVVLRHQHMIFRIESLSLLRFFPREDRPACIQTAASHHRTILPYHLTVCSSTLRRFVFSVENKMHS